MKDNRKLIVAKDWILKLANGINPLDGTFIPEDDIINNVHISRCLFYVAEQLDKTMQKGNKVSRAKKYELAFNISSEDLDKVYIADKTGIVNFTREINKMIPDNMKPLPYSQIINWLIDNAYLEEIDIDGQKKKKPTPDGAAIGITAEIKDGTNGPYWAVEYNSNAQRFILNNIYSIIES